MLLIFCICNVIPLVGILKSLEENESSIAMILARSSKWFFVFLTKTSHELI
jgi:hypothetical protein